MWLLSAKLPENDSRLLNFDPTNTAGSKLPTHLCAEGVSALLAAKLEDNAEFRITSAYVNRRSGRCSDYYSHHFVPERYT
jgi:hypothetical protein